MTGVGVGTIGFFNLWESAGPGIAIACFIAFVAVIGGIIIWRAQRSGPGSKP
jgi:hypothetical protein